MANIYGFRYEYRVLGPSEKDNKYIVYLLREHNKEKYMDFYVNGERTTYCITDIQEKLISMLTKSSIEEWDSKHYDVKISWFGFLGFWNLSIDADGFRVRCDGDYTSFPERWDEFEKIISFIRNPISFISDYPPEIQEKYDETQKRICKREIDGSYVP